MAVSFSRGSGARTDGRFTLTVRLLKMAVRSLPTLLALIPLLSIAQQERANPFHGDAEAAEAGRGAFRIYCRPCHGIDAKGGRGPDLTTGNYMAGNRDEDLFAVIAEGVSGTDMAAYEDRLPEETIWSMISYIRMSASEGETPVTGDPAAGEKLFWEKAQCGNCHRIGRRGGRLGPDLTTVGRSRSVTYLRQSMTDPNADFSGGYQTLIVTTLDGGTIEGIEKNYDNFSAQLMDAQENFHSFLSSDVRSIKRELRSLMPAYGGSLSGQEIDNLLAYLAGLGREESQQ